MKKTFSLEELKKKAGEIFKKNPDQNKLLASIDGNIFFLSAKNAAELHSRTNGNLTIHEIERPGYKEKKDDDDDDKKGNLSEVPTEKSTVKQIQEWLTKEQVDFEEKELKASLLEKVNNHIKESANK